MALTQYGVHNFYILLGTVSISGQNESRVKKMYLRVNFHWRQKTGNSLLLTFNNNLETFLLKVGQIFFNICG